MEHFYNLISLSGGNYERNILKILLIVFFYQILHNVRIFLSKGKRNQRFFRLVFIVFIQACVILLLSAHILDREYLEIIGKFVVSSVENYMIKILVVFLQNWS